MIPSTSGFLNRDFEIERQPDLAYRIESGNDESSVRGFVEGKEAVKQAVMRMLSTERYKYVIYPWWYGIETEDLYGEPVTYVCPELERRITEALAVDERVMSVSDFEFDLKQKHSVHVMFTVHTIYGDIKSEKGVDV